MKTPIQCLYILALLFSTTSGQIENKTPWPTYSLQNMPRTGFTCQDKILGGYYADPETQCQMFHVCVKVAGVGVQDFRFLCPNGTAFDQEAQICADWGDVDCEQATLYYSSDNFDLYRIGSGFESKRAPLADEDEALFHLQRAESSGVHRSKQTIVDQHFRLDQGQDYPVHFSQNAKPSSSRNFYSKPTKVYSFPEQINNADNLKTTTTTKTPYYPKSTVKSQATVYTTKPYEEQYDYKQEDEIFKGSHSSNFFNNRNNGKEEDVVEFTKSAQITKPSPTRTRQGNRGQERRNNYNNNILPHPTRKIATTAKTQTEEPRIITAEPPKNTFYLNKNKSQILTLQSSFRSGDLSQYDLGQFRTTTESPSTTSQAYYEYNLTPSQAQFHQNIQPTTYSPTNNNDYKFKPTTNIYNINVPQNSSFSHIPQNSNPNPFYNEQFENNFESYNRPQYQKDRFEKTNDQVNLTSTNARQEFNEFKSNKSGSRTNGEHSDVRRFDQNVKTTFAESTGQNRQHLRKPQHRNNYENIQRTTKNPQLSVRPLERKKPNRVLKNQTTLVEPKPRLRNSNSNNRQTTNSELLRHTGNTQTPYNINLPQKVSSPVAAAPFQNMHISSDQHPRAFSLSTPFLNKNTNTPTKFTPKKAEINNFDKYQPITRTSEDQTPSTAGKKFSTRVPKDQYYPTTFRPTTYKKQIDGYNTTFENATTAKYQGSNYLPTTATTTTSRPQNFPDENDGQYHPELYESDFARYQFKESTIPKKNDNPYPTKSKHEQKYNDFSEEDEFLKTAHSLNIAAGANQLRAEKAGKPTHSSSTLKHKTTFAPSTPPKKPRTNEDTSYDYAYYDSFTGNPHDYSEYDFISEFSKTKKQ